MLRVLFALALSVAMANSTYACEMLAGSESPLEMRKPVRGEAARLTAGFGVRMHPILSIPRMHLGVDWGAPLGTPVIAAGRGRVIAADRDGEYGNRIII